MADTVVRTATQQQVTARSEPPRANSDDDSIGRNSCKNAISNAGAVAGIPKLDFLCAVLEIDEHFNKTNMQATTIDWKTIENFKSPVDDRLASPSCSDDSSSCENRGNVNVKRCISPSTHPMPFKPCLFESLGRPLPRPPMLPSSLYQAVRTAADVAARTDKKRKLKEYENDSSSNATSGHHHTTFHCKAKVYLPSGKSLDIVAPTAALPAYDNGAAAINNNKKRAVVVTYQRCTDLRMDPLSPPPFTLPKRPVGFRPRSRTTLLP